MDHKQQLTTTWQLSGASKWKELKSYWRHGSVVRTSVFNWQTFPDLHLIYG